VNAILTDGSVVELVRDCNCTDHTGPHWLHEDAEARRLNHAAYERWVRTGDPMDEFKAAYGESERLKAKAENMTKRGIERLLKQQEEQP
jgi:hypothetical protein